MGASRVPFTECKRERSDRVAHHWRILSVQGRRAVRHVVVDTNYWKSFVHARLNVAMGDKGRLSLFGRSTQEHRMFAEHLTAEYRVRTEGRGRALDEWKVRAGKPDNHWLDCLVGCAVAASVQGAALLEKGSGQTRGGRPLKLSEVLKRRCRSRWTTTKRKL